MSFFSFDSEQDFFTYLDSIYDKGRDPERQTGDTNPNNPNEGFLEKEVRCYSKETRKDGVLITYRVDKSNGKVERDRDGAPGEWEVRVAKHMNSIAPNKGFNIGSSEIYASRYTGFSAWADVIVRENTGNTNNPEITAKWWHVWEAPATGEVNAAPMPSGPLQKTNSFI